VIGKVPGLRHPHFGIDAGLFDVVRVGNAGRKIHDADVEQHRFGDLQGRNVQLRRFRMDHLRHGAPGARKCGDNGQQQWISNSFHLKSFLNPARSRL
jgi:hypothetical protein